MLKRFILWDYPRATWQYDVMVGIILVFVMLTPARMVSRPAADAAGKFRSHSAG